MTALAPLARDDRRSVADCGQVALGLALLRLFAGKAALDAPIEVVEVGVEDRRDVQRDELRERQSAHDGDAERPARLRARARAERDRQRATSAAIVVIMIGRKRTCAASTIASAGGLCSLRSASSAKSIIMIAFFFTMPIEQDDADESRRRSARILKIQQREQRAERGERKAGENRQRVDEALVQHAEHDVDDEDREDRRARAAPPGVDWNACAVPEKPVVMPAGRFCAASRCDLGGRRAERRRPAAG